MSRIIVKNLPNKITEVELRKKFGLKGTITDCSLKFTEQGVFRNFAFIGFKTEDEAKDAVNYFNKSFINAARIEVNLASDMNKNSHNSTNTTVWSKHSKQKIAKNNKTDSFLGVSVVKDECPAWSIKVTGLPTGAKVEDIIKFFKPIVCRVDIPKSSNITAKVNVEFNSEKDRDEAMKRNKNFIGPKKIFLHKSNIKVTVEVKKPIKTIFNKKKNENDEELISETGRLFLRNLPYCCTTEELEEIFSSFGLCEVQLPIDRLTKKVKGYALVTFVLPENALAAFRKLDATIFQGRMLHIVGGEAKKDDLEDLDFLPFSKKKELLKKSSANSSHNWNSLFVGGDAVAEVMAEKYGTTKHDILLEDGSHSVAVRLALGQTQIVNETRDFLVSNGVSLDSFSQASGPRCKRVLLAKHLPAMTSEQELMSLFGKFGVLTRILLPPNRLTAVIEFQERQEAEIAFKTLAYTKFKDMPLYLEWAPVDVFLGKKDTTDGISKELCSENQANLLNDEQTQSNTMKDSCNNNKENNNNDKNITVNDENQDNKIDSSEEDSEYEEVDLSQPRRVIFIKNLSPETTEKKLKEIFGKCGKIVSVTFVKGRKQDDDQEFKQKSCFVEYGLTESAEEAMRSLQMSKLEGQTIQLRISDRRVNRSNIPSTLTTSKKVKSKKSKMSDLKISTKILVRNVPFQATVKDLKQLFGTDGDLKSVRLPKKVSNGGSGDHRGFAFVDFITKQDAKRAFNRLCHNTALYGRRLNLEWAMVDMQDADDSLNVNTSDNNLINSIRKRTANRYNPDESTKRIKKSELLKQLDQTNDT